MSELEIGCIATQVGQQVTRLSHKLHSHQQKDV